MPLSPMIDSSSHKVAIGQFTATESKQTVRFSDCNIEGDTDFEPSYLFVYAMFPNSASGSATDLTNGTHINILDKVSYSNFAYRATVLSGNKNLYRSEFPSSSGGSRIHTTNVGEFEFTGLPGYTNTYCYVAIE